MSSPTFTKAFKDDKEVGCIEHNWGFVTPHPYLVCTKIISMVSGNYDNYGKIVSFPREWDYLLDRFYGKLSRKNYELLYNDAKDVFHGKKDKSELNLREYFEVVQ